MLLIYSRMISGSLLDVDAKKRFQWKANKYFMSLSHFLFHVDRVSFIQLALELSIVNTSSESSNMKVREYRLKNFLFACHYKNEIAAKFECCGH